MYAFDLLKALERGKFTFTGLLDEIQVSRATLSSTLQALVDEGYVNKQAIGRYTVYRITQRGLDVIQPSSEISNVLLGHLTKYVARRLEERGLLKKHDVDKKELSEEIEKHAQRLLKDMIENIEKSFAEE
ncbi:MAG: winged helix-turn-helix domain-containing protein [Candidatus Bathyarchaeia archaeon]